MRLEDSLSELRRHFADEMTAIEATLTRSIATEPRDGLPRPHRPEAGAADAGQPPDGLRIENFVSGVATK